MSPLPPAPSPLQALLDTVCLQPAPRPGTETTLDALQQGQGEPRTAASLFTESPATAHFESSTLTSVLKSALQPPSPALVRLLGIGIDLFEPARLQRSLALAAFRRRVFLTEELALAEYQVRPLNFLGEVFAIKEATRKALAMVDGHLSPFHELLWDHPSGVGEIRLVGGAAQRMDGQVATRLVGQVVKGEQQVLAISLVWGAGRSD